MKKDDDLPYKYPHYECVKCGKVHSFDPDAGAILAFPLEDYDMALIMLDVELKKPTRP